MGNYILALDQGTTSSRAIVFDHNIEVVATASHGNRDMTFFATFEAMFHGIGDQLGQHQ